MYTVLYLMILTDLYFTTKMKMKIMLIKEIMMHVMLSYNSLNSKPPFFFSLNTDYQPIQRNASYDRTVHIMHR